MSSPAMMRTTGIPVSRGGETVQVHAQKMHGALVCPEGSFFATDDVHVPDDDTDIGKLRSAAVCTHDELSDGSVHVAAHRQYADV